MYHRSFNPYNHYINPAMRGYDQRFFPFFGLPFIAGGLAGLAISPFLFNRPCCPPYYPPYPPYGPYGAYGAYGGAPYGGNGYAPTPYNVTENINIYPQTP
ncbi:hypothetical protein [Bacillus sp. Marseille-Q1617]|uniref:hypothetical protein n=1 Tax=Bacillus sp. Marseille-Q1617 TaxID=2736887 RepID=UPI00158913A3|nr:hypothetical protein [Bacillus sp. Marseille-Q1617]